MKGMSIKHLKQKQKMAEIHKSKKISRLRTPKLRATCHNNPWALLKC
jgi:hypothetical protein